MHDFRLLRPNVLAVDGTSDATDLEQRVLDEAAQGHSVEVCVPLFLQAEAVRAMERLLATVQAQADGTVTAEAALNDAQTVVQAWNQQLERATELLRHPPRPVTPRPRMFWTALIKGRARG